MSKLIIRPTKLQVIKLVSENVPEYVDLFMQFKTDSHGWLIWPDKFIRAKENLKIDTYVLLYKDQLSIDLCLFLFLMGKEGFKEWNNELSSLSEDEQKKKFEVTTQELIEDDLTWLDEILGDWPRNSAEEAAMQKQFLDLPESDRQIEVERAQFLFSHIFLSIHNYFSIMVNGESLVSLVQKSLNGDAESFRKAVKIDRNLLVSHPFFKERYLKAQNNGERNFLKDLSLTQCSPNLISKIRYPGLYMIFAMLQVLNWLDDFSHEEILDICDAAGLDRWQNRIEDVNSVTKQLSRYRRYQKTGGVSMH